MRDAPLPLFLRGLLFVCAALIFIFTLSFGGKSERLLQAFEDAVLTIGAGVAALRLVGLCRTQSGLRIGRLSKRLAFLAAAMTGVGLLQLAPFPILSLAVLSPKAAELYGFFGQERATLTLDVFLTAQALRFFIAWALFGLFLVALPPCKEVLRLCDPRRLSEMQPFLQRLCTGDGITLFLQTALIRLGALSAVIALSHWGLRSERLFGLFEPSVASGFSRAHLPLVNPNHLAVLLEICSMTALTVLLKEGQLRTLLRGRGGPKMLFRWSDYRHVRVLLATFVMWTAVLLTLSRTGATLTFLGALGLFLYASWNSPTAQRAASAAASTKRIRRLAEQAALFLAVLIGLLFFLGDSGRDLLAGRVEYAITQKLDFYRLALYHASLAVIRLFPLFGAGLGCWRLAAAQSIPAELSGWTLDYAHNDPVQFAAEAGCAGGLVLMSAVFIYGVWLRRALRAPVLPTERLELVGMATAVLLPLVHSFVDFPFHIPAVALAWLAGLSVTVRLVERLVGR